MDDLGPPLATGMSQNFNTSLIDLMLEDKFQIILPVLITISFFIFAGFYKSMIRFGDLLDTFSIYFRIINFRIYMAINILEVFT